MLKHSNCGTKIYCSAKEISGITLGEHIFCKLPYAWL